MGIVLYILVILACFHSILHFLSLRLIGKVLWSLVTLIPFLGPLTYAGYRIISSDSTMKEILQSRNTIVE